MLLRTPNNVIPELPIGNIRDQIEFIHTSFDMTLPGTFGFLLRKTSLEDSLTAMNPCVVHGPSLFAHQRHARIISNNENRNRRGRFQTCPEHVTVWGVSSLSCPPHGFAIHLAMPNSRLFLRQTRRRVCFISPVSLTNLLTCLRKLKNSCTISC